MGMVLVRSFLLHGRCCGRYEMNKPSANFAELLHQVAG
jgi:hypothetical protein